MAGIFGDEINNRKQFFEQLSSAIQFGASLVERLPQERMLKVVAKQLKAIQGWTAGARQPTLEERKSIHMGLQMFREYETTDDDDLRSFSSQVGTLDTYFIFWPDDKTAADPNNDDYLFLSDL
jgi:hypothetical protein